MAEGAIAMGGLGNGLLGSAGELLQLGIVDLIACDHLLQTVQVVQVARQLRAAVPAQVFLEALVEPGFLLAIHFQVVIERPGNDHIEVAVSQADPIAGGQHQTQQQ